MIGGACHAKAAAAPAAATRAAARPGGSVYCACHAKGSRGPDDGHARRSSSRSLCVTAPATRKAAAAPAAATRAAARPGGSVHAKGSRGPSGGHARRSSSRRLCALRLPQERQRPQRRPRAPQLLQDAFRLFLRRCPSPVGIPFLRPRTMYMYIHTHTHIYIYIRILLFCSAGGL